jgi:hypothetical protein
VKTAIDLIDDPLHGLRKVARRFDLPMPGMDVQVDPDGTHRYVDEQWPKAYWTHHWFFPNETPAVQVWGANGTELRRESYEGPVDALRSVLTVPGGTGHFVIEELVAEFLTTRLVHDPLYWQDVADWKATGKPIVGAEWSAAMAKNTWVDVLARKEHWNLWFAELVAHIAEAAGLVEIGYSIYSSRLTDRAKAWALLIRIQHLAESGKGYDDEYAALLAMGADDPEDAATL